jgi:hypothetical protein
MSTYLTTINNKLRLDKCGGILVEADAEDEPCCCCFKGCVVVTVTLHRPIVWPGVSRCAYGWRKYENVSSHPVDCRSNTHWRIINLPTCTVYKSGEIKNGVLQDFFDRACYPMPYDSPCPNHGPFTFSSILWLPIAYFLVAQNILDWEFVHCDGDLSCRYVLQLQTACEKDGQLIWPEPECVPVAKGKDGIWTDVPDPEVPDPVV